MPIRNYAYGSKAPHINADRVADQMWLAHRYRNSLIEIERWRREQVTAIQTRLIPGLAQAQTDIEKAKADIAAHYSQISQRNSEAKSRTGTKDDRERTAALREVMGAAIQRSKEAKAIEKSPEFTAAMGVINEEKLAKERKARADSGVYWGSYLTVDANARTSFSRSVLPPKFLRWEGHGTVSIHGQPAIPAADALAGKNNMLRIELDPVKPHFAVVYLRIGTETESSPRSAPVWAAARVKLHRPIPEGSMITWAYLERSRVGLTEHWQFRLTLDIPEASMPARKPTAESGAVGIDVGWRSVKNGLRVAYWVGTDGEEDELVIPTDRIEHMRFVDSLRSRRDLAFNEMREAFSVWLKQDGRALPAWLVELTEHIGQWRSPGRQASVIIHWRNKRFEGDASMYDVLEAWRKQDKHLCNFEGHARSTHWRKEIYRMFAVEMSRRYKTLIIEDTDWRELSRKSAPDKAEDLQTRWYARAAAVGELSAILKTAGAIKSPGKNSTRTCSECGFLNTFDAAKNLHHTCDGCGAVWDQDANAARNHLAHGLMEKDPAAACEVEEKKPVKTRITAAEWRKRASEKRTARKRSAKLASGSELG